MSSCFQTFLFFCENNCFQTAIAGVFVHIRNVLFCARAPSSFVYEWTHTAWNECLTLRDVYLALFWVRIKHQVMHRLSCLFEFKSIFIHTGSWKFLCEHTPEKKCEGWIYVILKVGGGTCPPHPPCDLRPRTVHPHILCNQNFVFWMWLITINRLTTLFFFCIMVHLMVSKCTCFAIVLSIFL